MNFLEKVDYTLLALYQQTRERGMLSIIYTFTENGQALTIKELKLIISHLKGLAVFQVENQGTDYRGQITPDGVTFTESNSFSKQGTPILDLAQ